jgi:hypothetical protein
MFSKLLKTLLWWIVGYLVFGICFNLGLYATASMQRHHFLNLDEFDALQERFFQRMRGRP